VKPDRDAPPPSSSRARVRGAGDLDADAVTLPGAGSGRASSVLPRPPESSAGASLGRGATGGARGGSSALRGGEVRAARALAGAGIAVSALTFVAEPALHGPLAARGLTVASVVALGAVGASVWRKGQEPAGYTRGLGRALSAAWLAATAMLTYRLGVFSPAPVLTALTLVSFGLGEDRTLAVGHATVAALAYVALGAAVTLGLVPDAGLVPARGIPPEARAAMLVFVPAAFAVATAHARLSRRATLDAIQRSTDWLREVRQREVQLEEANRDLDMLLKMSAGDLAPYSGVSAGEYVLGDRIGRGAMGEVYSAKHAARGTVAAVKLLHPSMQDDAMLMQRFLREGEATSKLRAPNVVAIYGVGKLDDGAPYIAMELLRGHDLGRHLRRRGALSLDEVLAVVEQVARGLDAARLAGVVHRDLKPQNLFLAQQPNAAPVWKILDFGVSRIAGSTGTLTKDIIVGTPGYMSPEQAGGLAATHRSDVFSLGAVVYRALTGEPPFTAEDLPQTLYQVVYKNPPRPSELAPALPPDVDLVLAVALAKDPSDRFASAPEMADAFRAASRHALDPELRLHGRTLLAALPWSPAARARNSMAGDETMSE
jgi:serine/threonine protein kinase